MQALTRLALLWRARHPALSITAVFDHVGNCATSPVAVANALGSAWFSTFTKKASLHADTRSFLSTIPQWSSVASVSPPCTKDIESSISLLAAKATACGPDGICYAAWAASIELASNILFNVKGTLKLNSRENKDE